MIDSITSIISNLLQLFLKLNLHLHRYMTVYEFLKPYIITNEEYKMIRVGSKFDGGYLIPNYFKETSGFLFSGGIGNNNDFEADISKKKVVFQFDHTIDEPPIFNPNLHFSKLKISTTHNQTQIDLDTVLNKYRDSLLNSILKLDIEGDEWKVLAKSQLYSEVGLLIIEFHALETSIFGIRANARQNIIKKLHKKFTTLHIHANNCCGVYEGVGWRMPRIMEVTLINNKILGKLAYKPSLTSLPLSEDSANINTRPDIYIGNLWSGQGIGL